MSTESNFHMRVCNVQGLLLLPMLCAVLATAHGAGDEEQQWGKQSSEHIESQIGVYNAEFLETYVDSVGRRLAANLVDAPYRFRFKVVERAEPNVFGFPGAYIFISRGMLALINSEDELAAILAHEISHVALGHHERQTVQASANGVLSMLGDAVGAVVGDDVGAMINARLEAAGRIASSPYSSDQEVEADLAGMELAAKAGYDPGALGVVLGTLSQIATLMNDEQGVFSFDHSHPTTPTRLSDIDALAGNIAWTQRQPFAANKAVLFRRLDGLWWGPNNPRNGVFEGRQFLQPDMDFTITFPDGWRLANTPNYVGAFERNGNALIVLGGGGPPGDPSVPANTFIANIKKKARIDPAESEALKIGEWPAYLVRFEDVSGAEPVNIYYLWVASRGLTFQVIAIGTDKYREELSNAAMSMRNLTKQERESIYGYQIWIAEAEQQESLGQLSARADNAIDDELVAVLNAMPADAELQAGDVVKVVRKEYYGR